ncbi:MAG: hypothetical protein AAFU64_07370 [Bacteroidota bacterium]
MRSFALLLLLILTPRVQSLAQMFDCQPYYQKYCQEEGKEKSKLPNKTQALSIPPETTDTSKSPGIDCIHDIASFCEGVQAALEQEILMIRQAGDPGHVSACAYHSYERYGVMLVMTGNIIWDEGIFDQNAGFNFVMKDKIKEELGAATFELLGKEDSTWLEFDQDALKDFWNCLHTKSINDTTAWIQLDKEKFKSTKLGHLEGVLFTDPLGKKEFNYQQLKEGQLIHTRKGKTKRGYLRLDFQGYTIPFFVNVANWRD